MTDVAVDAFAKRPGYGDTLWAGYAFSKRLFNLQRGHMHAIEDITAFASCRSPTGTVLNRLPAGPARARMFPMMEAIGR